MINMKENTCPLSFKREETNSEEFNNYTQIV